MITRSYSIALRGYAATSLLTSVWNEPQLELKHGMNQSHSNAHNNPMPASVNNKKVNKKKKEAERRRASLSPAGVTGTLSERGGADQSANCRGIHHAEPRDYPQALNKLLRLLGRFNLYRINCVQLL